MSLFLNTSQERVMKCQRLVLTMTGMGTSLFKALQHAIQSNGLNRCEAIHLIELTSNTKVTQPLPTEFFRTTREGK